MVSGQYARDQRGGRLPRHRAAAQPHGHLHIGNALARGPRVRAGDAGVRLVDWLIGGMV